MLNTTSNFNTVEGPKQWKMDMRHGTLKVKSHCWSGSLWTVAEQLAIHLVAVQEVSREKRGTE